MEAPAYARAFFDEHLRPLRLDGSRVLEIGCGWGQLLCAMRDVHPNMAALHGVNYPERIIGHSHLPRADAHVHEMDAGALTFDDASFDVIYSLATFEHLPDFAAALSEFERVLRPGGRVIAKWSPIWNAFNGHHYGSTLSDPAHRDIDLPWAHLIFERESLAEYLCRGEGFSSQEADDAVSRIYESDWLNRLAVDQYEQAIERSGLRVERFDKGRVELAGLLRRISCALERGVLKPERVLAFFERVPMQWVMVYKLAAHLRKVER